MRLAFTRLAITSSTGCESSNCFGLALPFAEICAKIPIGQPQISKHLRVLRDAGVVHAQPRAQQRFYALRAALLRELDEWLNRFHDIWGSRFDQLDELLRGVQLPENGE